jgi:hypothetical protein
MSSSQKVGSYIFGGLFMGIWLYILLFGLPEGGEIREGHWLLWGIVGFVLAGAIYGSRLVEGAVRIGLYVAIGVALAMVLMGFLLERVPEGFATLFTFVGAGLVVAALDPPNKPDKS